MSDKQPMQAMSTEHDGAHDGVGDRPDKAGGVDAPGGGESAGGAYPNPHSGNPQPHGGFMGHGGQSRIDYSGTGAGSGDEDEEVGNVNAVTGKS
jgi:hypothetical protein